MSRIDTHEIQRLKDQIVLSELVGRDVAWDPNKSNPRRRDFWACCPFHGEKSPSFHVDDNKQLYHCFGCGVSGDAIKWLTEFKHLTFAEALREIGGEEIEVDEERQRQRDEDAHRARDNQQRRHQQEEATRARRADTAAGIWSQCSPIVDTVAERYLLDRGIPLPPMGWPDVIGFHKGLEWELGSEWDEDRKVAAGPVYPCLIGRVQNLAGDTIAVWRIFLDPKTGKKAPVANPKLGLGPAKGGAVRIGGIGPKVGVAEGMESTLAAWTLVGWKFPVWSTLSTSGMMEVEFPLKVKSVPIFPDGDRPLKRVDGEFVPNHYGAGMRAAMALRLRLQPLGIKVPIQMEPSEGTDYLDVLNSIQGNWGTA